MLATLDVVNQNKSISCRTRTLMIAEPLGKPRLVGRKLIEEGDLSKQECGWILGTIEPGVLNTEESGSVNIVVSQLVRHSPGEFWKPFEKHSLDP